VGTTVLQAASQALSKTMQAIRPAGTRVKTELLIMIRI
jgi:hypothetical protein